MIPATKRELTKWVVDGLMHHLIDGANGAASITFSEEHLRWLLQRASDMTIQATTAWLQELDLDAALAAKRAADAGGLS